MRMSRKKKPVYRLRNVILAIVLLIGLAIGREVYLALTATPGSSENFPAKVAALIEESQPPGVPPESPDAFEILSRVIPIESDMHAPYRAGPQLPNGHYPIDYTALRGPQSRKFYGAALETIQANSRKMIEDLRATEFYSLLDEAAAARRAVRPTPLSGDVIGFLLPHLGKYRNLARLNSARMYLAHQSGDESELARAFEHGLAPGRVAGHGSFLIEYLVGVAIHALMVSELREELVERPVSEQTLLKLLAVMDRQELPSMRWAIEGERLGTLDTIQWTHTDDGKGSGRLIVSKVSSLGPMLASGDNILEGAGAWRILNIAGAAFPSKAASVRRANEFYDAAQAAIALPHYQRNTASADLEAMAEAIPKRYILLRMMLPAWGKAIQSMDQIECQWQGTKVMLAIEIYRQRHGRPPASLDELVPGILPHLPKDPYTGSHFGYRILDPGTDPHGRAYLLYTAGRDGTDNGGVQAKQPYDAFRTTAGKGVDYVLNEPRLPPEPDEAPDATPDDEPTPEPPAPEGTMPPTQPTPE